MPKAGSYDNDTSISNLDKVLGTDNASGKTANYLFSDIANFVRNFGLHSVFAIFADLASETTPVSIDTNTAGGVVFSPVRLDFQGALREMDYLPAEFGNILTNVNAAPASSSFDFLSLDLGDRLRFILTVDVSLQLNAGGVLVADTDYAIQTRMVFPSGRAVIDSKYIATAKDAGVDSIVWTEVSFDFSDYIKTLGVDDLVGGEIGIRLFDNEVRSASDPKVFYKNIRITAEV